MVANGLNIYGVPYTPYADRRAGEAAPAIVPNASCVAIRVGFGCGKSSASPLDLGVLRSLWFRSPFSLVLARFPFWSPCAAVVLFAHNIDSRLVSNFRPSRLALASSRISISHFSWCKAAVNPFQRRALEFRPPSTGCF